MEKKKDSRKTLYTETKFIENKARIGTNWFINPDSVTQLESKLESRLIKGLRFTDQF